MNIEKLFELKAKNLSQLGSSAAIDVISDHPEEFIRLLVRTLEKRGFSFLVDAKKSLFRDLRDKISGTALSKANPLLDARNQFHMDLEYEDKSNSVEIKMSVSGNSLDVYSISMQSTGSPSFSIKMKGLSANDVIDQLVNKVLKVREASDAKITSREDWEKARALLHKKDQKGIESSLERICQKFGGALFSETEGNRIKFNIKISPKVIGIPNDILSKLKSSDFGNLSSLSFSYQFDIMKKIWSSIYKAINNSDYKVITAGVVDYLWFEIEIVNPERENLKYRRSYQEVHEKMKDEVESYLSSGKEKATQKTISDLRRLAVKQIIEKDEV